MGEQLAAHDGGWLSKGAGPTRCGRSPGRIHGRTFPSIRLGAGGGETEVGGGAGANPSRVAS